MEETETRHGFGREGCDPCGGVRNGVEAQCFILWTRLHVREHSHDQEYVPLQWLIALTSPVGGSGAIAIASCSARPPDPLCQLERGNGIVS